MKKTFISPAVRGPRRCVCSKCASCVDNGRWERIFQEKYRQQERDYYAAGREPHSAGVSAKALADASIYTCAEEGPSAVRSREEHTVKQFLNLVRNARCTDHAA
jgi:hypothetical protein